MTKLWQSLSSELQSKMVDALFDVAAGEHGIGETKEKVRDYLSKTHESDLRVHFLFAFDIKI
jgi:hypothetical protein